MGEIFAVGGDGGAKPRLEPRVDAAHLTLLRDRREAPEGSRRRQEREQAEVEDELELEAAAAKAGQARTSWCRCLIRVISAGRSASMRAMVAKTAVVAAASGGARGQLPPAPGPSPGPCSARGGAQDARSDPGDDRLGLPRTRPARVEPGPPGALPATGCPAAGEGPRTARPVPCRPRPASPLVSRGPGSADPAADGRASPRGTRPAAPRRPQPPPARRRVAVSEPRPRARMSACHSFAAPVRSAWR